MVGSQARVYLLILRHIMAIPLLLISGPVGVGKTTVGEEVSNLLEQRGVTHTFLDMDCLAATYPRPSDDRFGTRLALLNLREVWTNCVAAGSRNLIISRVVETQHDVEEIQRMVPTSRPVICLLRASHRTLVKRVRARELGSGRSWHEARAIELAKSLERSAPADFVIETEGRPLPEIADEVAGKVDWVKND